MKMKYVLIAFILMLSICCVNGAELDYTNPYGLSQWVAPEGFVSADPNAYDNVLAVCWDNNISILTYPYISAGSSGSQIFVGATGLTVQDAVFTKDYVFIVYNNGQVYRINQWFGIFDWSTDASIGENVILVTTVSTTAGTQNLDIDSNGFVYVTGNTYIYKINPETLTTTASAATASPLYSLNIGSDGIYTGTRVSTSNIINTNYYKWSSLSSNELKTFTGTSYGYTTTTNRYTLGISQLSNGNFFVLKGTAASTTIDALVVDYGNATTVINNLDIITFSSGSFLLSDMIALPNGYGFISSSVTDKVYSYSLEAGGIGFSGSNYVPAKLLYDNTDIYTDYGNYYNGSNVDVHYAIGFDTILQSPTFTSKDTIINRFNWKIELISPDNVMVNSFVIPENYERTSLLSSEYYLTNSVTLNNINPNGTWSLNLFEIDTQTNEKSLLDTISFTVLFEGSGSTGIGTGEVIINNPVGISNNIIQSSMFYALIIILVCGGVGAAYGGGVGFVGGAVLGVVASAAFGLLPMLYVIILVIIFAGLLASGLASKITGGE